MSRKNGTTQGSRSSRVSLTTSHDRKLRYRALLEDLSTIEDEGSTNTECIEKTASAVKEAQELLAEGSIEERARHPGEGYLDSRVLKATSDLAVRCSEAVSGNANVYDRHELAQHMRENPSFWSFSLPRCAPAAAPLFGAFSPAAPAQRARVRRVANRQPLAALRAPENVDRLEKTEEGSEMVSRVNRFITKTYRNSGRALSYFHVVLDPGSFSRTVENVYHVSFLVKDGLVSIQQDEDHGLPFITPVDQTQRERHNLSDENQFIVSIDMQRWQDLIEAFRIETPMMVIKR
ncbi:non-structural maintenance of chromosomes element 4 homolog A [Amyelois transitella]|uniref:non-structural maintenance of chromosomes element 4 homolog A n=1 Tax=Amyelois transitella TaxID=680683 RepID=UPI00067D9547|nr:non-structural maintenance of chromosomes element 4 homolog A [Amyelois transitella]